jgi:hypothetical protein
VAASAAAAPLEERALGPSLDQIAARYTLEQRLRTRLTIRWDPATGAPATVRFTPEVVLAAGVKPEQAARLLLRRLGPLYGVPGLGARASGGVRLPSIGVERRGPWTIVRFEQRVGSTPVEGSQLKVVMTSQRGRTIAVSVVGRLFNDVPTLIPLAPRPPALAAETARPSAFPIDTTPQRMFSPRGGAWDFVFKRMQFTEAGLTRVLVDRDGRELERVPAGMHAWARGRVFGLNPGTAPRIETIRDLHPHESGNLTGPYETVINSGRPHAPTARGKKGVSF